MFDYVLVQKISLKFLEILYAKLANASSNRKRRLVHIAAGTALD